MKQQNFRIVTTREFKNNKLQKKIQKKEPKQIYKSFALLNDQTFFKMIYKNWRILKTSGICSIFWIASQSDYYNAVCVSEECISDHIKFSRETIRTSLNICQDIGAFIRCGVKSHDRNIFVLDPLKLFHSYFKKQKDCLYEGLAFCFVDEKTKQKLNEWKKILRETTRRSIYTINKNYLDAETGEILNKTYSGDNVRIYKKFTQINFPDTLLILISYKEKLSALGFAVFCFLMENANQKNEIKGFTSQEIAESIGASEVNVRRKIKVLRELNIFKIERKNNFDKNIYHINSKLSWKSSFENLSYAKMKTSIFINPNYFYFGNEKRPGLNIEKYTTIKNGFIIPKDKPYFYEKQARNVRS